MVTKGTRHDDDPESFYDRDGDEKLTPAEVRVLKMIARAGLVTQFLVAILTGGMLLVGAAWAIYDKLRAAK
jgi:hypothetical protein